jgi:periplasmic copper chaperone A
MAVRSIARAGLILAAALLAGHAAAAGRLKVERAWIRTAPPGSAMLAGYAVLHNSGDAPVIVHGASSPDFGAVSIHETIEVDGVERMQALDQIEVAPDATVTFAPGGKHFMLMRPSRSLASGAAVTIHLETNDSDGVDASFAVREDAPAGH